MDATDLLLTAITITLGVTLVLCCYFHKCAPSRKKSSPEAGIVTVSILESLPMVPNVRVLPYVEGRQQVAASSPPLQDPATLQVDRSSMEHPRGHLSFTLKYNAQDTKLKVLIQSARNLPMTDFFPGKCDPYVCMTLLPDRKHRFKTQVKKNMHHPHWCETFCFEDIPLEKLQTQVLQLHVFDYDRITRDDSIGEVLLPLWQVDLLEKQSFCEPLRPATEYGDLLMSLCYTPNDSLTVTILKAWDLRSMDINLKSDPYVKLCLKCPDRRVEKRKTKIVKCTLNPVFNEAFTFNVTYTNVEDSSLEVVVMDFDNIGRDELIGRIVLAGRDSTGESECRHWQEMVANPRITVVQWHRLKAEPRSRGKKTTA
ncbi:synaptotagmin-7-like [Periplaneta americana]|uniref:synaptotagmin-7-like n=1 Tax=Periplaneta americana TaxID=6978 RepID=UPI0037E7CF3B